MNMRIRFRDAPHLVRGNFTDNNFIETDSPNGMLNCSISIVAHGEKPVIDGCRVFLPASTKGSMVIHFGDDNSEVRFHDDVSCNLDFRLWRQSTVEIGRNTTCNGCRIVADNSDVVIGEDCMFSDEILLQSNDQHGLIDLDRQILINDRRRLVRIGDHVWVGRRSIVMPDVHIGQGAVVGSGAVVVKDIEPFTYNVGVPSKKVRERSSWTRSPSAASPREVTFFRANGFPLDALG